MPKMIMTAVAVLTFEEAVQAHVNRVRDLAARPGASPEIKVQAGKLADAGKAVDAHE